MSIVLNLELNVPRLRPSAFPWGAAEVTLAATIRTSSSNDSSFIRHVDLPSNVDLSTVFLPSPEDYLRASDEEDNAQPTRRGESLAVEIIGCDHGVTFSIGTATLDIPYSLKPGSEQTSSKPKAFRLALMDGTAAKVGVITGVFVARRQAVAPEPKSVETQPTAATSDMIESQESRGHGRGGNCHEEDIDSKVAALLELASRMLTDTKGLTSATAPHRPRNSDLSHTKRIHPPDDDRAPGVEALSGGRHHINHHHVCMDSARWSEALLWLWL